LFVAIRRRSSASCLKRDGLEIMALTLAAPNGVFVSFAFCDSAENIELHRKRSEKSEQYDDAAVVSVNVSEQKDRKSSSAHADKEIDTYRAQHSQPSKTQASSSDRMRDDDAERESELEVCKSLCCRALTDCNRRSRLRRNRRPSAGELFWMTTRNMMF
jgi:hypothetical protein